MKVSVLGLDIGGTHLRAAVLCGDDLVMLEPHPTPSGYGAFLDVVAAYHQKASSLSGGPVTRMGLGLPGITGQEVVQWMPNIRYLDGRALAHDLWQRLGSQVTLANDAQMALLGENWRGAAQGCQHALLLSLGTGIGGALLLNGQLVRGATGGAGASGWLVVRSPEEPGDLNHGQLERLASGTALARRAAGLEPPMTSYEAVRAAREGHPQARALLDDMAALLGDALAGLVSVIDPEVVLISGGLSGALDLLQEGIRRAIQRSASPGAKRVPIRAAALGEDAGVYGAVYAARSEIS